MEQDMWAGAIWDGQYIYFVPNYTDLFLRFNTLTMYFQDIPAWETVSKKDVVGRNVGTAFNYVGGTYDGNYVYFAPLLADTFLRFNSNCLFTNTQKIEDYEPRAIWRTTDWPRRYRLPNEGFIYFWIYLDDITHLSTDVNNFRFEIGKRDEVTGVFDSRRRFWETSIRNNGWNRLKFEINEPHDSTNMADLQNMDYAKFTLILNDHNHACFELFFDDLKWVDPGSFKGLHGGYLQNDAIYHEGSVIIDTKEWITDNQTLDELVRDIFPLGFHPWYKFTIWFNNEVYPDSTADYTWMRETRLKIFHRRKDMNATWVLANDTIFDLSDHGHVEDDWPPHSRHQSPGPDITTRST